MLGALARMDEWVAITILSRQGPLNMVADTLARKPQRKQLYLSDEDAAICTKYLKHTALQFALK